MTTILYLAIAGLATVFQNGEPLQQANLYPSRTETHIISADLVCPDEMDLVIDSEYCTKRFAVTAPSLEGFAAVEYVAIFERLGVTGLTSIQREAFLVDSLKDANLPAPEQISVTEGQEISYLFYAGQNTVKFIATDIDDNTMSCTQMINVLDGVAPWWDSDTLDIEMEGICGLDHAVTDIWEAMQLDMLDNCCSAQVTPAVIIDTVPGSCGGEITVTLNVDGWDGSGDGDVAAATPCNRGGSAKEWFSETLVVRVKLLDDSAPVISGVPSDITISCDSVPEMPQLTATDICAGDLTSDIQIEEMSAQALGCGNGELTHSVSYRATVEDGCGNADTVTWTVFYMNMGDLIVDLGADLQVCTGESVVITANAGTVFEWSTGSTAQSITVDVPGEYFVTAYNENGCCDSDTINVEFDAPTMTITTVPATNGMNGSAWATGQDGFPGYTFEWSNGAIGDTIFDLSIGQYFVTVTDANGCRSIDSFFLEPQTTVCDLAFTFVSSNTTVADSIRTTNPATQSLYAETCITDALGSPAQLLSRQFFYTHRSDQVSASLNISSADGLKAFVFTCETFEQHTEQTCIGISDENEQYLFDKTGSYFIVVAGIEAGAYMMRIEENLPQTVCDATSGRITCGEERTENVDSPGFFSSETGHYEGCYRGPSNKFEGAEKVYSYEVGGTTLSTISITPKSDVGVFIYNYQCATDCISAFEAPEGVTTEDEIRLNPGLYFIVIDQDLEGGDTEFTIQITCDEITDDLWPDRRTRDTCKFDDEPHLVEFPSNVIDLDSVILGGKRTVNIYFLDPTGQTKIGDPVPIGIQTGGFANAEGDFLGDSVTCGYLEGEKITIAMKTTDNVIVKGSPSYDGGGESFEAGGKSVLMQLVQEPGTQPLLAAVQPLERKDVPWDTTETVLTVQTSPGQNWNVVPPNVSWIKSVTVRSTGTTAGVGVDEVVIVHEANDSLSFERSAAVRVNFPILGELLRFDFRQGYDTSSTSVVKIQPEYPLNVYPNPSSGIINVELPGSDHIISQINVMSIEGRLIKSVENTGLQSGPIEIHMEDQSAGIYLVEVIHDDISTVRKVVLQN